MHYKTNVAIDECDIKTTESTTDNEIVDILSKDELKDIARELLDSLRPRKLQIWQVKEVFRYAIEFVDRERLK